MIAAATLFGFGLGSAFPAFMTFVMSNTGEDRRARTFGSVILAFDTGIGVGSATIGAISQRDAFRVPGEIDNRFNLDEYNGVLRIVSDEFRTENRRSVRVVIRQDFATGELLEQVIPGKGADVNDPAVAAEAARRLARLRSEVGL